MWQWLKKFKWRTVFTHNMRIDWEDTKTTSHASVSLQENGFGWRRVKKHGSLYPRKHEEMEAWHTSIIPWVEHRTDKRFANEGVSSPDWGKVNPSPSGGGNIVPFRRK